MLANDTDADTAKAQLQVALGSNATSGVLSLAPTGAFTYTPGPRFTGTDSFTYQVTDPNGLRSNAATVTLTVGPVACGPRPTVTVTTAIVGGALQATVTATDMNTHNNTISKIQFGTLDANANATVTLNGQTVTSNQTITLPPNTTSQTLSVRRIVGGKATTVPLTVTDTCGAWPTFVGGGPSAGF